MIKKKKIMVGARTDFKELGTIRDPKYMKKIIVKKSLKDLRRALISLA